MWKIGELKSRGKAAFKANYWKCVLVSFVFSLIGGLFGGYYGASSSRIAASDPEGITEALTAMSPEELSEFLAIFFGIFAVAFVVSFLVSLLLIYPFTVGAGRFYLSNSYAPAEFGEVGYGFKKGNYGRSILALFLMEILICLGCIVIIPGFILSYSYRLVPYIIADDPDISASQALKKSRMMMQGHKWRSFLLDLSFIGWIILSMFTLGILIIFYVAPYMSATDAELYKAVKGANEGYATAPVQGNFDQPQNV